MHKAAILFIQSIIIVSMSVFVAKGDDSLVFIFYIAATSMFLTCIELVYRSFYYPLPSGREGKRYIDYLFDNKFMVSLFAGFLLGAISGHKFVENIGRLLILRIGI